MDLNLHDIRGRSELVFGVVHLNSDYDFIVRRISSSRDCLRIRTYIVQRVMIINSDLLWTSLRVRSVPI